MEPSAISAQSSIIAYGGMAVNFEIEATADGKQLVEYIRISHGTGDEVRRIAQEADRTRYKEAYARFIEDESAVLTGTPLSDVPGITRRQVAMLQAVGFVSVEQFREANETAITSLGMDGRKLHDRVSMWFDASQASAEQQRIADEKAEAQQQVKDLTEQMAQMKAMIELLQSAPEDEGDEAEEEGDTKPKRRTRKSRTKSAPVATDDGLPDIDNLADGDPMTAGAESSDGGLEDLIGA